MPFEYRQDPPDREKGRASVHWLKKISDRCMKCPVCNQQIKLVVPPGLSKKTDAVCPVCAAPLKWERVWSKGVLPAIAGAALFLALNALVLHSPYGFAFSVAGAVIGFFVGSRRLVAS
jgi:uncharacterized paraquat-inducible protein A